MRRCACCGVVVKMMCEQSTGRLPVFCGSLCRRHKCVGHVGSQRRNGTTRSDFLLTGVSGT